MSYTYRSMTDASDAARDTVREMVGSTFGGSLGGSYWDWKYQGDTRHPAVFLAESDDEVVGCRHSLVFDLRIEHGLTMAAMIGGDLLVLPEHRGHDVARRLASGGIRAALEQDPQVAAYATFTWPGLAQHLAGPLVGIVPVPSSTRRWSRILGWDRRIDHLYSSGFLDRAAEKGVAGCDHTMQLEIEGAPPLWVEIKRGDISLSASPPVSHQIRVSLLRDGIEALKSRSPVKLLTTFAHRGIRVRGRPRFLREVFGARRAYTMLLQELLKKPGASDG